MASRADCAAGSRREGDAPVTVVIVNYRTPDLAMKAVESVRGELSRNLRVVVVDGGSGDGSAERLKAALASGDYKDWVEFLPLPLNGGFGWANNQAILSELRRPDPPDFIHLLNPDAVIHEGAISLLRSHMAEHPRCGAAGSQILAAGGEPERSAHRFASPLSEFLRGARTGVLTKLFGRDESDADIAGDGPRRVDWVTGASVMLRVRTLEETGLFDDGFFLYSEEVELMWRMRKRGWEVWHVPASRISHIGGASTGVVYSEKRLPTYWYASQRRFLALAYGRIGAFMAYLGWSAGHLIWLARRRIGLASGNLLPRQGLDHLRHAFPRRGDAVPAFVASNSDPGVAPAWIRRGTRPRSRPSA